MTCSQEKRSAYVAIKCVLCGHRTSIPLTPEQPMCPKCLGPVVVEKVRRG